MLRALPRGAKIAARCGSLGILLADKWAPNPCVVTPPNPHPSCLQVTWIYEPKDGVRINIAVLHPSFQPNYPESPVKGRVSFTVNPPNLSTASIQISDVRMSDEGRYICEYATYPRGNEQGIVYLVMLGRFPTPCWVASGKCFS